MTVRLAVYGLLRRGERLAHLMAGADLLGEARIDGYALFDLGEYPGAVGGGGGVVCEIYEAASPAVLDLLDEAEGVFAEPPLFRRELVEALGAPAWIYVYAGPVTPGARIASGDWKRR